MKGKAQHNDAYDFQVIAAPDGGDGGVDHQPEAVEGRITRTMRRLRARRA